MNTRGSRKISCSSSGTLGGRRPGATDRKSPACRSQHPEGSVDLPGESPGRDRHACCQQLRTGATARTATAQYHPRGLRRRHDQGHTRPIDGRGDCLRLGRVRTTASAGTDRRVRTAPTHGAGALSVLIEQLQSSAVLLLPSVRIVARFHVQSQPAARLVGAPEVETPTVRKLHRQGRRHVHGPGAGPI